MRASKIEKKKKKQTNKQTNKLQANIRELTKFESAQRSENKYQLGESKANRNQFDGKDLYEDLQNRDLNRKENRKAEIN